MNRYDVIQLVAESGGRGMFVFDVFGRKINGIAWIAWIFSGVIAVEYFLLILSIYYEYDRRPGYRMVQKDITAVL